MDILGGGMNRITTQSLFHTSVHKASWQSYAVSTGVHVGLAFLAFAIVVPVAVEVHRSMEHITYVAPVPEYKPKPIPHIIAPRIIPHPVIPTPVKTFIPPPVVVPVVKQRPIEPKAPEIKVAQQVPDVKIQLPPAPKAPIQTGVFQAPKELAKGAPPPPNQKLEVGGFGDPHGAAPSESSRNSGLVLPKVGAFDMPDGAGRSGRGGSSQSGGTVRTTGFGVSGPEGRPPTTQSAQAIQKTTFGDAALAGPAKKAENVADAQTPVQILFKPKPVYTPEARSLRLEGEVSVQVVFQADGTIRVLRVIRGLGHGLDEAAVQAATRVRFKPATRGGVAVDTNATITISFELT